MTSVAAAPPTDNPWVEGIQTLGETVIGSLRVLREHWPQLVGLFLLGWIGRMTILWAAVEVSNFSPTIAVLLIPLAPLCMIVAMVLMLRVVGETLSAFQDLFADLAPGQQWRDHFTVVGQVLLPFLAVYASQGMLREDTLVFLEDTTMDELMNSTIPTFDRALYAPGAWIIVMIVVVLVLRKIISLADLGGKSLAVAGFAAYLEALWLVTVMHAVSAQTDALVEWIGDRAVIVGLFDSWGVFIDWLGALGTALTSFISWLGGMLSSTASLFVMPVSMLAVGAAVYGSELKVGPPIPTHEGVTRRLKQVPSPLKRVVGQILEPITTPVVSAWNSFGKILVAGVIPMLLFCIVFLLLNQIDNLVALGLHALIGPRDVTLGYAVEPFLDLASQLVFSVLAVALLAAAVNALIARPSMAVDEEDRTDAVPAS